MELVKEIKEGLNKLEELISSDPIKDVVKLNEERYGLTFNPEKAIEKLEEELQEFKDAVKNNDIHEMIDALTDLRVIAIGEIRKAGYDPKCTLKETVKEISSRRQDPEQAKRWANGEKEDGEKWLKDKSQDKSELYKADYKNCIIKG